LKDTYHLNDLKIGLCYLYVFSSGSKKGVSCLTSCRPSGFGALTASLINGRQIDWYYRREEKRVGGDYRKKPQEFRIELTRLRCIAPFLV